MISQIRYSLLVAVSLFLYTGATTAQEGASSIQGQQYRSTCSDDDTICLNRTRFAVEVDWMDFDGGTGAGQVVEFRSDDSGMFWFFNENNWELLIKVLDGCAINDRFWVFAAATTDVEYTLNVTDTLTGETREYFNPLGSAASAITDTTAFATCSAEGVGNPSPAGFPGPTTIVPTKVGPPSIEPLGDAFQVNTDTAGCQLGINVSKGPGGDFMVAWFDYDTQSTLGRTFQANGEVSEQFSISPNDSRRPAAVQAGADGDFVVAWNKDGVITQRIASDGSPLGPEQRLDEELSVGTRSHQLTRNPNNSLLAVWQAQTEIVPGSGFEYVIAGRRLNAGGAPIDDEFVVNSFTDGNQYMPQAAVQSNGDFIVTWESTRSPGSDNSAGSILARQFSSAGRPLGEDFQVNTDTMGRQGEPSVATANNDNFLVVWTSNVGLEPGETGSTIRGQLYSPSGTPLAQELQVNSSTTLSEDRPRVIQAPDGGFLAIWRAFDPALDKGKVMARRLTANGEPVGDDFEIVDQETSPDSPPGISNGVNGEFVVAWGSECAPSGAGYSATISAREFRLACTDVDTLCLNESRFEVEVEWTDFAGENGIGQVVPFSSDDSGLFYFFDADNWELLVKVLRGCNLNDHYWVFSAATTDVEYTLRVTDTLTGQTRSYFNPLGTAAEAVTDVTAFATCP